MKPIICLIREFQIQKSCPYEHPEMRQKADKATLLISCFYIFPKFTLIFLYRNSENATMVAEP